MRWIDGVDLGRLLADGPLAPERALPLLAVGRRSARTPPTREGLIHRDVKPENVLVEGELGSERAFLTDFGIGTLVAGAERPSTRLTGPGLVLGTADYMAPEQIRGEELDGRADVYSLACLAFHALAGRPPFAGAGDIAALASHGSAPRPALSAEAAGTPPGCRPGARGRNGDRPRGAPVERSRADRRARGRLRAQLARRTIPDRPVSALDDPSRARPGSAPPPAGGDRRRDRRGGGGDRRGRPAGLARRRG